MAREQLAQQQRQFQAQQQSDERARLAAEQQRQAEQALSATQLDPLRQQRSRQLNALMASLFQHSTTPTMDKPGSGLQYNASDFASFFTPDARANAEAGFTRNASLASGGRYAAPNEIGYGAGATTALGMPGLSATPTTAMPAPTLPRLRARTLEDILRGGY